MRKTRPPTEWTQADCDKLDSAIANGHLSVELDPGDARRWGGRDLTGDELRAANAARIFAQSLVERNAPWPILGDDVDAFAEALKTWRTKMAPIEAALRAKRESAIEAANAIRRFSAVIDQVDTLLFPDIERALHEIAVYEMFTAYSLQLACRKGRGSSVDRYDTALRAAAYQLERRGLSTVAIAKVLGVDRKEAERLLCQSGK
jgi:hypothetical protein